MSAKVLLVEDSPTQAAFYRESLEELGLQVVTIDDGSSALIYALETPPDLIVLDVNLPGMDGFQVCSRLQRSAQTKDVPIIMLTQNDRAKDASLGFKAGAIDYIAKDEFAIETLVVTLQQIGIIEA